MNLTHLNTLVAAGESLTLELKKSTAEKDRACRTMCALANGLGGQVVFGVTPAGKVVGQRVTDRTLEELAQEFQGFEPPLFPQLQRVPLANAPDAGHEVLLVQVEAGLQPPTVTVQGDCVVLTFRLAQRLGGGSEKTPGKTSGKIIDAVCQNPQITIPELATQLGVTPRSIERNLQMLQAKNRLARIGPANGGYWKVILNE